MSANIIELTEESFNKQVLNKKGFVLIDFWAPWCGPCRMMSAVIEEVASEVKEVEFGKVNVDKNQSISTSYRISSIPCFVLFKNGKAIVSRVGGCSKDELKDWLLDNIK